MIRNCPHCQRQFTGKGIHYHVCPEDPALRPAIMAAMEDPARPGTARSGKQYGAIAVMAGAPSLCTMLSHFVTWRDACAAYGLVYGLIICPHCGRQMQDAAHPDRCVAHPDLREAIMAALEDPDRPGHAVRVAVYARRAAETGAPDEMRLRNAFDNWSGVCRFFGLAYRSKADKEQRAIAEVEAALEADAALREYLDSRGLAVSRVREIDGGRRVACMLR